MINGCTEVDDFFFFYFFFPSMTASIIRFNNIPTAKRPEAVLGLFLQVLDNRQSNSKTTMQKGIGMEGNQFH